MAREAESDEALPGTQPVRALPYRLDEEAGWSLELRLIIASAMVVGLSGVASFATTVWIYFQPARFRTVGGFRSAWSAEFTLSLLSVLLDVTVIGGAAAFFARRSVCRPMLTAGSVGKLLLSAAMMVYYTFFYGNAGRYGADLVVWMLWRGGAFFTGAIVPVLTLAVITRPYVKERFRPRMDE